MQPIRTNNDLEGWHRRDWLQLPPTYWELMFDSRFAKNFCVNLQIVNDCTKRALKLVQDF